jgi:hypothetical protein
MIMYRLGCLEQHGRPAQSLPPAWRWRGRFGNPTNKAKANGNPKMDTKPVAEAPNSSNCADYVGIFRIIRIISHFCCAGTKDSGPSFVKRGRDSLLAVSFRKLQYLRPVRFGADVPSG